MSYYNKYKNSKVEEDGYKFDSLKERARYRELKLLLHAGQISELELQPKFLLLEAFESDSGNERAIHYIADFKYIDKSGRVVVEDAKGMRVDVYKIKRKLFKHRYPSIKFREV